MRTIIQTAIVIAALLAAGAVHAATPGRICREACTPRISRDCGAPGIRGSGKCKRKLVRACRKSTPELACALTRTVQTTGGASASADGGSDGALAAQVTAALANKLVGTGSSQFFSSGSITETDDMTLCGSGQAHLVVTTITSTFSADFSNTFDDTKTFDGTWSVTVAGGAATLELAVGEPEPRRFAVELDAAGNLLVDGRVPTVSDASGVCGGGSGGTPGDGSAGTPGSDPVAQITQALADQFLFIEEDNIGFGHRVTAMVLCASGRYALEIDASVLPGVEVSTSGDWSVRLDGSTAILGLAGEGTQPTRTFTLGTDASGNLTLNGISAQLGVASVVSQTCPAL